MGTRTSEEGRKSKAVGGSKKGHSFVYPGGEGGKEGRKAMANRRDKGAEVSVSVCCAEKVGQMNESFIKWLILI